MHENVRDDNLMKGARRVRDDNLMKKLLTIAAETGENSLEY